MNNRQIFNEKGMTLVELLASLGLLAVFIGLSSTLIFQSLNSEEEANKAIILQQETNIIINELRNDYLTKSRNAPFGDTFPICYTANDEIEIYKLTINGELKDITNGCINNVKKQENLSVEMVTSNSGESITIQTTWTNRKNHKITLELDTDEDDINIITEDDLKDYCNTKGNTLFDIQNIHDTYACTVIDGNATFPNELYFDKENNLRGSLEISVDGSAIFMKPLYFQETDSNLVDLTINGDAVFEDDIVFEKNHHQITINGNATFSGKILLNHKINNSIIVTGSVQCGNEELGKDMTIQEDKDCSLPE
ncbi:type II secretion system protein [Oceanobacillus salinisoli]|uniref:type II secretion system protein n=1 Tax=Oceanobacillus salinisoli TaxID=2678611 RepID=UPI0012E247F5|nr:type II secretion system protein [Oceanobacillus salinisoli]